MEKYITSNLILESADIQKNKNNSNYSEKSFGEFKICHITVGDKNEKYTTLYTPKLNFLSPVQEKKLIKLISNELSALLRVCLQDNLLSNKTVLVAGLGNRRISSDALGVLTVEKINVTRHVALMNPNEFKLQNICSVCAVNCGVMGETGIRSLEILQGAVGQINPSVIIAVDALAAGAVERLGATIQITDAGVSPGAGIGNRQSSISRSTLNIPVIAIGVPTVVSAATIVQNMLDRCGIVKINSDLKAMIEESKGFFVAPKECDLISDAASTILAQAIDNSLIFTHA